MAENVVANTSACSIYEVIIDPYYAVSGRKLTLKLLFKCTATNRKRLEVANLWTKVATDWSLSWILTCHELLFRIHSYIKEIFIKNRPFWYIFILYKNHSTSNFVFKIFFTSRIGICSTNIYLILIIVWLLYLCLVIMTYIFWSLSIPQNVYLNNKNSPLIHVLQMVKKE